MSLNDIQLSTAQLVDLYGRHLVAGSGDEAPVPRPAAQPPVAAEKPAPAAAMTNAPVPPAAPKPLQYLGKNQKKTAILVNYPNEVYLPEGELNFLTSILQACRLNLGDVAIVNHAHYPLVPAALYEQLQSQYLLIFGVPVAEPALQQLAPFTPLRQNDCNIVQAPPLDQLNNNSPEGKLLKTKLWGCLKQLFNV
jgi:hypothetical protein